MHTFLKDRLTRVAKDWQQNLAALEEFGAMTTTVFDASLKYWQVCFPVFTVCHHTEFTDLVGRNEQGL